MKEKVAGFCTLVAMKKLFALILFVLNLLLSQAQEVKIVSVNGALQNTRLPDSISISEEIHVKNLYKHFVPDSIRPDTLTTPYKWMLKLVKKLTCKQRKDNNIYIFFVPRPDSVTGGFLPITGKYGYVFVDTTKKNAYSLENQLKKAFTHKYQWDLIHNPRRVWFAWLQDEEEGAYIDENCFKDPNNYNTFKSCYDPLKKDALYMKVFKMLDNSTKLAYCFDELTDDEIEENSKSNKIIGGGTYPYEKATFIGMRNIKTHKKYWFKEALEMKGDNLQNLIKSEDWKGRIGLNMKLISSYVIFHELNHAVQNLLELEGKAQYSGALSEVETRMICFYAAFLKADVETRKDYLKMREFLISFYKNSNIDDLMPLTGDKIVIQFSEDKKSKSDEEIYSIIYKFFSGIENNDFNKIMAEYAKYIKNFYGYTYNPDDFKPNYYLYNLIK